MKEVAILGVGLHPWGKFLDKSFVELGVEAARQALKDADMQWRDIESLVAGVYMFGGRAGLNAGQQVAQSMGETGIPITNIYNACATATSTLRTAYQTIASGASDIVMCLGLDMSPGGFFPPLSEDPAIDYDVLRWKMVGLANPGYWALELRKRMHRYGTTERDAAMVKVVLSKAGKFNPLARYRRDFTLEEVLNSPMVYDPLRLYEICATSDGAGAVILGSVERARRKTTKPIIVAAASLGSRIYGDPTMPLSYVSANARAEAPIVSESYSASQQAYRQAGIGPEDIDVLELPDNSSWHYFQYLETLGFCKPGEAEQALRNGETVIGGRIPTCPSGGVSCFGEAVSAQGMLQIYELVLQLRGVAGHLQVPNARVAMAQTYGLAGNSAAAILKV